MSQVPAAAATSFNAFSSVTLTAWTEQVAVFDGSFSFVSVRVVLLRPRRMSCFAPAVAKARAVSRPIPLPFERVSGRDSCYFRGMEWRRSLPRRL